MPWIALLALSVSIDLVSLSTRVTSVKSATRSHTQLQPDPQIGPQGHLADENAGICFGNPLQVKNLICESVVGRTGPQTHSFHRNLILLDLCEISVMEGRFRRNADGKFHTHVY